MTKEQTAEKEYPINVRMSQNDIDIALISRKILIKGWEACEKNIPIELYPGTSGDFVADFTADTRFQNGIEFANFISRNKYHKGEDGHWYKGEKDPVLIAENTYDLYNIFDPNFYKSKNNPFGHPPPIDYKTGIRQMMDDSNTQMQVHLPELFFGQKTRVQSIIMDAFLKTFPPGADLEQIRKDYNEIKPCV